MPAERPLVRLCRSSAASGRWRQVDGAAGNGHVLAFAWTEVFRPAEQTPRSAAAGSRGEPLFSSARTCQTVFQNSCAGPGPAGGSAGAPRGVHPPVTPGDRRCGRPRPRLSGETSAAVFRAPPHRLARFLAVGVSASLYIVVTRPASDASQPGAAFQRLHSLFPRAEMFRFRKVRLTSLFVHGSCCI